VGAALELRGGTPLEFFEVDPERFPAVPLARRAGETGGVAPCVLNAANEVAVAAFLNGECRYDEIVQLVSETVDAAPAVAAPSLDDILDADAWARERMRSRLTGRAVVS
jgi:1-deoxy-D-xylulose-5-phosphate reductoisomerase